MNLCTAYSTIIKDLLLYHELGTEKEITPELAEKLVQRFQQSDHHLNSMEEILKDEIIDFLEDVDNEFELF